MSAVGIGLVASAANATGVASADDSSSTNSTRSTSSTGTGATKKPDGVNPGKTKPNKPTTADSTHPANTADSPHPAKTPDTANDGTPTATPGTPSPKAHRSKQTQTDPGPSIRSVPAAETHPARNQNADAASSVRPPAAAAVAPTNVVAAVVAKPEQATTPIAAPSTGVVTAATSSVHNATAAQTPTGFQAAIDDALKAIGLGPLANHSSSPFGSVDALVQATWLAARQHRNAPTSKLPAAATTTSGVPPTAAEPAASANTSGPTATPTSTAPTLGQDLREFTDAVQHIGLAIGDEIGNLARNAIGMAPGLGALLTGDLHHTATPAAAVPAAAVSTGAASAAAVSAAAVSTTLASAAAVSAAATPAAATNDGSTAWLPGAPIDSVTWAVMHWAVDRLAGLSTWIWHSLPWPGTPHTFVSMANNVINQSLDAANAQLNALIASPGAGTPAAVVSGFLDVLHFWLAPAVPNYTFADTLNAMGDFLNRIVPQVSIAPGAGTLNIISVYKIVAAGAAGAATVLGDMLNGVYDPAQLAIDAIYTTTGAVVTRSDLTNSASLETKIAASILVGGGVYSNPGKLLSTTTLPTWTAAQVNPITIFTYVVMVALYDRFQEISNNAQFTTSTSYESWLYTLGSGSSESEYAAGTFTALDQSGRPVNFQPADGATYKSAWGALVTINTYGGGYTYTATLPGTAYFHAGAAGQSDTVTIPVYSADGAPYNVTFSIKILGTPDSPPAVTTSAGVADALGIVRGTVTGTNSFGDTMAYSLVSSSVKGLSGNSAYTNNGGIVTLNSSTGAFTYTSTATGGSSASFQVQVDDGHGGIAATTVTVPNSTAIAPAGLNTSTLGVVTGSLPAPSADAGMYSYALGSGASYGNVSFNPTTGAFTYTRTAAGHTAPATDSFTVIGTDANGRTVSFQVPVTPTIANTAPTLTLTTAPGVGTLSGSTQTSTGKFTATDAEGDTVTYSATTGSQGGTLTINPDGSFTYTGTLSTAIRHAAAKIGATSAQMNDTFTVTGNDGFGGTTTYTVNVPIYAVNTAPTISGGIAASLFGLSPTVTSISVYDADGDSVGGAYSGGAGYTITSGFNFVYLGNQQSLGTSSINAQSAITNYSGKTVTLTVYDGYHTVVNGVVQATASSASKSWTF